MQIEHIGYQVADPLAAADWYIEHLGFTRQRGSTEGPCAQFLADDSGRVMIEIYNNPRVEAPDYASMDPLILHLAMKSDDPAADRDRLMAAGATVADDLTVTPAGDTLVMLRDPWGLALQLCQRATPMV